MHEKAKRFFDYLKGRRVLVVGIGVSHRELIGLMARMGVAVIACDRRSEKQIGADTCRRLREQGARLLLGAEYPEHFEGDVLLRTPGMYYHAPELQHFRAQGGVLTSEMEIFFDLCECPIIALTGSDGKTTTSTLAAEMLRAQGHTVHLGGNIGKALLPRIFEIEPEHFAVVELSSFQLISMRIAPQVSVITNIEPNHLDVHRDMDEYIAAKRNIFEHQNAFSTTVLSADNAVTASFREEVRGRCRLFSLRGPVDEGAFLDAQGYLCRTEGGRPERLFHRDDIRLPGVHNVANFLAAICAVRDFVGVRGMHRVAGEFGGVEHRIEFVREVDGARWYNDSISSSPTRAIAGLRSFAGGIVLLAGGYDKNLDYAPLAPDVLEKVRLLILTGPTASKIEAAVTGHPDYRGSPEILHADDLERAVALARRRTRPGDTVLLSPASASFDAYPNFEARGRHFKELVSAL